MLLKGRNGTLKPLFGLKNMNCLAKRKHFSLTYCMHLICIPVRGDRAHHKCINTEAQAMVRYRVRVTVSA